MKKTGSKKSRDTVPLNDPKTRSSRNLTTGILKSKNFMLIQKFKCRKAETFPTNINISQKNFGKKLFGV